MASIIFGIVTLYLFLPPLGGSEYSLVARQKLLLDSELALGRAEEKFPFKTKKDQKT